MASTAGARRRFDVCNGDADGLCAVVQWRLDDPRPAALVTGLKRDIELLERVPARAGDEVLACDVSLERNRATLERLLAAGVTVRWFDHHAAGRVPQHPGLQAEIDGSPDTCTSLIVDRHLRGRRRAWALVGAYGDNLARVADPLARVDGRSDAERARLRELGEAINYNAYGETVADVHIAPGDLYAILVRHRDPLTCVEREPVVSELLTLRAADLRLAEATVPAWAGPAGSVTVLPDSPWSRRVLGTYANRLAEREPGCAHAVVRADARGDCMVSVRAPLRSPTGAHELCQRFGGAGRAAAAGIDRLPARELDAFIGAFAANRWSA